MTHWLQSGPVGSLVSNRLAVLCSALTALVLCVALAGQTGPALAQSGPPEKPTGLTGTVSHDSVSLTWDDPGDASITGYRVLRRDKDLHETGEFLVHVDDTGSASPEYLDEDVEPETRYVYRIKARNAHGLSERSEWFDANTPAAPSAANNPATGAPVITGTAQVGETLTADTSGIADADGLTGVSYATGVSSYTGEEYKIPAAEGVWVIEASHDERFPATAHISTRGDVSAIPNTLTWPPAMAEAEDVVLPPDVGVGLIACAEADDVLVTLHDDQGVELQRYMVDIDPDAVVATPVPQEQPTGVDTQGVRVCVDSADHRANFLDGWEYAGAAFDWDALASPARRTSPARPSRTRSRRMGTSTFSLLRS